MVLNYYTGETFTIIIQVSNSAGFPSDIIINTFNLFLPVCLLAFLSSEAGEIDPWDQLGRRIIDAGSVARKSRKKLHRL